MPKDDHAGHGRGCPCVNEQALAAAREEAVRAERERVSEIQSLALPHSNTASTAPSSASSSPRACPSIRPGRTVCPSRERRVSRATPGRRRGPEFPDPRRGRRLGDPRRHGEAACLHADGAVAARRWPVLPGAAPDHNGNDLGEYLDGCGPEQQRQAEEMAREYRNFKLIDMAKEYLQFRGINHRGMGQHADRGTGAAGTVPRSGVSSRAAPSRLRTSRRSWRTSPTRRCARATKPIRAPSSPSAAR